MFIENFKKIHWDSGKEIFALFIKVIVVSSIAVGLLSGVQYLIELLFRSLA